MRPETAAAIYDAHQACTRITELVQTRTFEQVHGEWLSYSALERQFEIIGEALSRIRDLEPPVFDNVPDGAKIVGLRNVIIHAYDAVDPQILWTIANVNVPGLLRLTSNLLDQATREGL